MIKSIQCNETELHNINKTTSLAYQFVTDDGITPSSCKIQLNDIDPKTGERISDIDFFRDYYQQANSQAYHTLNAIRPPYSKAEKEERRRDRERIIREFEESYGYKPNKDDIQYLLEERWGSRYHISTDAFTDSNGESYIDCIAAFTDHTAETAFPGNGDIEMEALKEVTSSLTGRLHDVYLLMIGRSEYNGHELAQKWNVNDMRISRDKEEIKNMIQHKKKELEE